MILLLKEMVGAFIRLCVYFIGEYMISTRHFGIRDEVQRSYPVPLQGSESQCC